MDLQRGLRYPTSDGNWIVKILIGSLLSLFPIVSLAASGYMYDAIRNVAAGHDTPLPEWDNFGDKMLRGLIGAVISVVWLLPLLALACPLGIITSVSEANSRNGTLSAGATIAILCLSVLVLVVSLVVLPLALVAQARYAVTNDWKAALPGPVFQQVRNNMGAWITLFLALQRWA